MQGGNYDCQQIEEILGERLHVTIQQATKQVITHVDETIDSLKNAGDKLSRILKETYPGEQIISYKFE